MARTARQGIRVTNDTAGTKMIAVLTAFIALTPCSEPDPFE